MTIATINLDITFDKSQEIKRQFHVKEGTFRHLVLCKFWNGESFRTKEAKEILWYVRMIKYRIWNFSDRWIEVKRQYVSTDTANYLRAMENEGLLIGTEYKRTLFGKGRGGTILYSSHKDFVVNKNFSR